VVPDSFVGSLLFAKAWKPLAKLYLRWFYNKADLLLAVSDETKRDLEDLGVKPRIEVMYNSIDISRYKIASTPRADIRKKLGIKQDAFVVIGAGQVQPRKRVDDFITSAKKLPDVTFIWVGGMPFGKLAADNTRMQRMIDTAPKNMIFAGIVPLEHMVSYYHAADMFWLPSEQETFGLVVVEAAASGIPIMLRDIPDYDMTFGDDALKQKNIDDAVKNITHLRDNATDYKKWVQAAERIAERFDSKASAEQLVKLYQSLL
jgi:1,2-diacylglycerol-3-alpha-glucose alpha-1,2-galactosyltransferase